MCIWYLKLSIVRTIKRISDVFKYPKIGVKLRLIKFYFDNVIDPLEKYGKAAQS